MYPSKITRNWLYRSCKINFIKIPLIFICLIYFSCNKKKDTSEYDEICNCLQKKYTVLELLKQDLDSCINVNLQRKHSELKGFDSTEYVLHVLSNLNQYCKADMKEALSNSNKKFDYEKSNKELKFKYGEVKRFLPINDSIFMVIFDINGTKNISDTFVCSSKVKNSFQSERQGLKIVQIMVDNSKVYKSWNYIIGFGYTESIELQKSYYPIH